MKMKHPGLPADRHQSTRRTLNSVGCALWLSLIPPAQAVVTLHDVVEQTWKLQAEATSQNAREQELAARQEAAKAWTPAPPSISVMHRTDQVDGNAGMREWEAEIGVPLWLPGQKARQRASINAEQEVLQRTLSLAQLRIAGEVREAWWAARLADNERRVMVRKAEEAQQLLQDVNRRVAAGDLAPIDANQAQASAQQAESAAKTAELAALRAQRLFEGLTSSTVLPEADETAVTLPQASDHPSIRALQSTVSSARALLAEVEGNRRDNPEFSVALSRERSAREEAYDNTLSLRLRLPFASASRNQPRILAARADLSEAEARLANEIRRVQVELDLAMSELHAAHRALERAEIGYRLASENHIWISKAFRLGERDLLSRLRAENERFEAELAVSRARLEAARAQSRLNQSAGVIP